MGELCSLVHSARGSYKKLVHYFYELILFVVAILRNSISLWSPSVVDICIVIVSSSKIGPPKSIQPLHQIPRLKHKLWYEHHFVTLTLVLSIIVEGKHRGHEVEGSRLEDWRVVGCWSRPARFFSLQWLHTFDFRFRYLSFN